MKNIMNADVRQAGKTNAQASAFAAQMQGHWISAAKSSAAPPMSRIGHIGKYYTEDYRTEDDDIQAELFGDEYTGLEFYNMKKNNTQLIRFKDDHTCLIGQEEIHFEDEAELGVAIIAKFAKMSLQDE